MTIHIQQTRSVAELESMIANLYADNQTQEISPSDLREIENYEVEMFAVDLANMRAQDASVAMKLGSLDAVLHTPADPYGTLAKLLKSMLARLDALENVPVVPPPQPAEFTLTVDNYSSGFITMRLGSHTAAISDKAPHRITIVLAPSGQVGPGGAIIADLTALCAMSSPLWFYRNSALGKVLNSVGHTSADDVSVGELASWIHDHAILTVTYGDADPAHPTLNISKVELP